MTTVIREDTPYDRGTGGDNTNDTSGQIGVFPRTPNVNDTLIRVLIPDALYEGKNENIEFQLSKPAPYDITINFRLVPLGQSTGPANAKSPDFTFYPAITILKGQQNAFLGDAFKPLLDNRTEYTERYKLMFEAVQPRVGTIYVSSGPNDNFYPTSAFKIFDVKDVILRSLVDPSFLAETADWASKTEELTQYLDALKNTNYGSPEYSGTLEKIGKLASVANIFLNAVDVVSTHKASYISAAAVEKAGDFTKAESIRYDADKLLFVDVYDKFFAAGFAVGAASIAGALILTGTAPLAAAALTTLAVGANDQFVYGSIQENARVALALYYEKHYPKGGVSIPQGAIESFDIYGVPGQAYRLYEAAFDRDPDYSGLGHWIKTMQGSGYDLKGVANEFIKSAEFTQRYGSSISSDQFVTLLYNNVLGRGPDANGLKYWTDQLRGGSTRADVLVGFSESQENKANLFPEMIDGFYFI